MAARSIQRFKSSKSGRLNHGRSHRRRFSERIRPLPIHSLRSRHRRRRELGSWSHGDADRRRGCGCNLLHGRPCQSFSRFHRLFLLHCEISEIEVEAKVIGEKGRLASVVIEVRRRSNGELIALAKQWMASHSNHVHATSKL
ncbi:hypothetical protein LINPERHAP2_LOCUS27820 [Linum perenne]